MKVVFPFYSPLESGKSPIFIRMAEKLQKAYGAEIVAVTMGVHARKFVRDHTEVRFCAVYDLYEYMGANLERGRHVSQEELAALEAKYGIPNLWLYVTACDPEFDGMSPEACMADIVTQLRFWEELFAREKPDGFVEEGIGDWTLPVYRTAQEAGCRVLNLMTSRLPNRFIIHYNPFDRWERSEKIYEELKGRDLTPGERKETDAFMERFIAGTMRPPYMIITGKKPTITLKAPFTFFKYFRDYLATTKEYAHPGTETPFGFAKRWLTRVYRHRVVTTVAKPWEEPVEGERFFLFPHQYQPENSTKVLAPFGLNQIALIENVAKCMPAGTRLYVKMHTADLGMRPASYYRAIKRIQNVRLINPYVDSYRLQKQSLGILTITGTMGYESILFGKPVAVFARPFYHFYDGVIKVGDISALPGILMQIARSPRAVDDDLRRKFLLSVIRGTYPGEINFEIESAFSDENIGNLCAGIAAELGAKPLR